LSARGHESVGVGRILTELPHVEDGVEARGGTVLRAIIAGLQAITSAPAANGALVRNNAVGHRGDVHVVEDHEVIVGILMRLIKSLRDSYYIDVESITEPLCDGGGVSRGLVISIVDKRRRPLEAARRDPYNGARRRDAVVGELDAAVRIELHLKRLRGAGPGGDPFGNRDPTDNHAAGLAEHTNAAGGFGGVE